MKGIEIERRFHTNNRVLKELLGVTPYQIAQTYRKVSKLDDKTTYRIRAETYPLFHGDVTDYLEMTKKKVGKFTFEENDKQISADAYNQAKSWTNGTYLPIEIVKYRYHVRYGGQIWEIDVFTGSLEGVILAEIELPSEKHPFNTPPWVGKEITGGQVLG